MGSSGRSTLYHNRMDIDEDDIPPTNHTANHSPRLSYEKTQEKELRLGKTTNLPDNTRPPAFNNEATPAHAPQAEDVINIQLPYDPNGPTDSELWSGDFRPISLHGSVEHIASDSKNIKESLNFMAKYIKEKQSDDNQINDLKDLNDMGDTIWNLISTVYESHRDS